MLGAQETLRIPCPSLAMFQATCEVFAMWWAPQDGQPMTAPSGFVGVYPPPSLYAERLALTLKTER